MSSGRIPVIPGWEELINILELCNYKVSELDDGFHSPHRLKVYISATWHG